MMILQAELDGEEEITWEDVSDEANRLYFDNEDRMIQLARPGDDLVPLESLGLSEEDLDNELWSMGIDLWLAWNSAMRSGIKFRCPFVKASTGVGRGWAWAQKKTLDERVLIGGGGQTRTDDLWVMSPTSYHCSTPRCLRVQR